VRFRAIFGFLIAPICPGLIALIIALPFRIGETGLGPREFSETAWIGGLAAVLGYPVAFVFGVPVYIFLRWRDWNGLPVYVASGALLGLVVYGFYVLLPAYSSNGLRGMTAKISYTALTQIPLVTTCGVVAALCFWLIARPDRSALVKRQKVVAN
jgi:hypothetical protein